MGKRPAVAELGHPLGYLDLAPPPGVGGFTPALCHRLL